MVSGLHRFSTVQTMSRLLSGGAMDLSFLSSILLSGLVLGASGGKPLACGEEGF